MAAASDFHLPSIRQGGGVGDGGGGGVHRPSSATSTSSSISSVRDFRQTVADSSQQKQTGMNFRGRRGTRRIAAAGARSSSGEFSQREARSSSRESARSVHSHFSDYLGVAYGGRDPDGFVPKSKDEDCIKCMLRVPHDKCESHRYIRVGGGYRHSFWYIKVLLEEIELARHQALIRQKRLETIAEGNIRAVKTYIRSKSGRMVEKVIFMSEDDYQNFQQFVQQGGDPSSLVRKYLSKEDAQNLQGFDKEEQKAIKTVVRTKSGRVIEKIVYVSRDEYDKIQRGDADANAVLRRKLNLKDDEQLENWSAPKMRTITTKIRTKSGRIIEKKVLVSDEDYQKLKDGKTDLSKVLGKYLSKDEGQIEGWSAPQKEAMKVIKTFVRTKSGKLVEKTILMTEDEFKEFEKSGGDPNMLKRFMKLKDGEKIDKWEKASTVFADSDDDKGPPKKPGQRTVDKHGNVFEYVKDPLTGKVYKKQVNKDAKEKGAYRTKGGKIITAADVRKRQDLKQGKRNVDSESDYSYKSDVSVGGTRHVYRRAKNADGTYGDRESYHSSGDEAGQARRRRRRRERKHGNDSAKSYFSDVSQGGTRRVFVRERKADGTYGEAKEYHSDDSADFKQAAKAIKQQQQKAKERQHGSDSEHSYASEYSEKGTRTRKRRQKIRDEFGNVIGYGKEVAYESPQDSGGSDAGAEGGGGQGGRRGRKGKRGHKDEGASGGGGDAVGGSDSDHSYVSEVSEHGTRHIMRRERVRDAEGNVIGYGKKEEYTGKQPVLGHNAGPSGGGKSRKKRDENGEEFEVYSDTSDGGTKRTMRRKVIRDELGNVIGHGDEEVYDSDDADTYVTVSDGKGGKIRKLNMAKAANRERVRRAELKAAAAAAGPDDGKKKHKGKTVRLANGVEIHISSDSEVFSDASTDSEVVREQLANMTEEEKQEFLMDRAARQQARENRRRDKYGDEYSKLAEKNSRKKEERKQKLAELEEEALNAVTSGGAGKEKSSPKKSPAKSMVVYDNKSSRFKDLPPDDRGIGLGHDDWGQPEKGRRKLKDGNEADSESEDEPGTERRKRDKHRPESSGSSDSGAEIIRGKDGKILKKVKKDKDGNVVELEYDDKGNVVKRTVRQAEDDTGDYFEKSSDGKLRLKKGKKRLDLNKISREELRALGIDPNASKAEIMRQLRQKLGGDVDVHFKGKKIGAKAIDQYSDIDSDKLAEDDELDVETLTGIKRMRVIMKKGGEKLMTHMQQLIEKSHLADNATEEERATEIDFLSAYRLVDPGKLETYGKAFVVEDFDDMDGLINVRCAKRAIGMVPSVAGLSERQIDYALQVLGFDGNTQLTFRMFSVAMALCERVTKMDQFCRDLLEITNLIDIERKLALYKAMFYCNVPSDRDPNYIKLDSLRIELMAGGLNWKQQEFIIDKLQPNDMFEISFLDYLCYIPLFLSFHDNILSNPLDISDLKYTPAYRRRASAQRDMNPLAFPLKKNTKFMRDHAVGTLLEGKPLDSVVRKENEKMLKAFDKREGSISYPASAKGPSKSSDAKDKS